MEIKKLSPQGYCGGVKRALKIIIDAINDLHFKQFSEVQREVFNNLTSQRNFIVKSKTGSGKTSVI